MGARTAIIGISTSAFSETVQGFLEARINDFLSKPFQESQLWAILARNPAPASWLTDTLAAYDLATLRGLIPPRPRPET